MASDRPVFVVGSPRSGTTQLRLMLDAHPRIALPPASRFVLAAYERRHVFGDLRDPVRRRALARWIAGTPDFGELGLGVAELQERLAGAPPTLGSALGTVFQAYSNKVGKPRWGDTRPDYLYHLPTLFRLFPDAQVINVVRDGRDCVASHKEHLAGQIDCWARGADASLRARRTYRPDQYLELRYENLAAGPERELRRICAFLDERFDPATLRPSAAAAPRWRQRLTADEIVRCEAVLGSRLARFGYRPMSAAVPTPADRMTRVWLTARDRIGPARLLAGRIWGRVRYLGPEPAVAARLTSAQRQRFLAAG